MLSFTIITKVLHYKQTVSFQLVIGNRAEELYYYYYCCCCHCLKGNLKRVWGGKIEI